MRCLPILLLLASLPARAVAADSCVACHEAIGDELGAPVAGMKNDVHTRAGISCAGCHGGNPDDPELTAKDEARGYIGKPSVDRIPALCGRCHADAAYMRRFDPSLPTDQLAQYGTSVHGQRLAKGDTKVATCVSCHGVHGIRPPEDAASPVHAANVASTCARCHADAAYMAPYDLPTDQFAKYQRSVHGQLLLGQRDTSAPTCNDCHGNHGAFPPGASSVDAVCGQCHPANRDFFVVSPHKAAFDHQKLPECVVCHGNHEVHRTSDDLLGTGATAICVSCHVAGSKGHAAAGALRTSVDLLRERIAAAEQAVARAEAAGMEMGEAGFSLQEAREALVQTRNQVHTVDPVVVAKVAGGGTATAAAVERAATEALAELASRRWLAILPLGMIAVFAALVWQKIKSLEEK